MLWTAVHLHSPATSEQLLVTSCLLPHFLLKAGGRVIPVKDIIVTLWLTGILLCLPSCSIQTEQRIAFLNQIWWPQR